MQSKYQHIFEPLTIKHMTLKNRIVMTSMGNIRNPQVAEDILERGDADLIGMGRGLIADPEWVNKVSFGDEREIRKCISCNIGCAAVGLDVVEFFAPRGADVSIVEMMPAIGNGIDPVSKVGTFTLMKKYGVKQLTNTALMEVKEDAFLVKLPDGTESDLEFDYGFV